MAAPENTPPEAGRPAHILPNGEVRGSGSGAGGGNPGEDLHSDEGGDGLAPQHAPKPIDEAEPVKDRHNETYG